MTIRWCAVQGQVIWFVQQLVWWMGMGANMQHLAYAPTLKEQQEAWESAWFIRFLRAGPAWLVEMFTRILALIFFNRVVLWWVQGSRALGFQGRIFPVPSMQPPVQRWDVLPVAHRIVSPSWHYAAFTRCSTPKDDITPMYKHHWDVAPNVSEPRHVCRTGLAAACPASSTSSSTRTGCASPPTSPAPLRASRRTRTCGKTTTFTSTA